MTLSPLKKLAILLGATIFLQGCVAAVIGGGAVAAKVATDPRTTGTQIKAEGRVNAVSYNGRVLLIGQVPNSDVKDTATALAKGVEGVNEVYNELTVSPKISFAQISKDSWLTTQVKSNMFVDGRVKATDVKVISENGEVFLLGNVTQSQANAAADIASKISGVKKVIKVFKYLD